MKIYLVGGAVRDKFMGRVVQDRDWVVTGSTPEEMERKGFRGVGIDFLTYLHPRTHEEYSLARRERRNNVTVFDPTVTLEEDLSKRDLTINAMAIDLEKDIGYDPFGGQQDIENKLLRMVSSESFNEDPVRILRVARFAARYPDFTVEDQTMRFMSHLVQWNALKDAPKERIWKEISRGLMEEKPSRMLQVLRECGALKAIAPELDILYGIPQPEAHHPEICTGKHVELVIDYAAEVGMDLETRYACLMHDLGKGMTPSVEWPSHRGHESAGVPLVEQLSRRIGATSGAMELGMLVSKQHLNVHQVMNLRTNTMVKLLVQCDAIRRPERFMKLLDAAMCDARGREGGGVSFKNEPYPQAERFRKALAAVKSVRSGPIALKFGDRRDSHGRLKDMKDTIHAARVSAVKRAEREERRIAQEV